jgi:uncharacterized cupredoxin-like copper-binding protein
MFQLRRPAVVLASLALVTAACGDDSDDADDDLDAPVDMDVDDMTDPEDDGEADDEEAAADADGDTVVVSAVDYEFEDLPDTVPAGTTLSLVNESTDELHELVAFRIPDDEDRSVEELLAAPPEEDEDEGPPEMVILAMPGEEGMAVLGDGTLTEPGRYAIICAIPTGADPDEFMEGVDEASDGPPEVDGGPPHFEHGMYAELTVE